MLELLLHPCTVARLKKGLLSEALLMLAPPLTHLVLHPGRMGCSGTALAHGRDVHPILLPRHKASSPSTSE